MSPSNRSSEDSTPSEQDQDSDCDCESSKTKPYKTLCKDKSQRSIKKEAVKFMKSLLGPSLEDSVLKTIELGKTIINKQGQVTEVTSSSYSSKEEKLLDVLRKEIGGSQYDLDLNYLFEEGKKLMKEQKNSKRKSDRKSIALKSKMEKNFPLYQKPLVKKLANVSKIRSLDSDLKQDAPSPEKIKRQLEALIQINKDELPKHGGKWNLGLKVPKYPVEMTIMPSLCMYKNEVDVSDCGETHSFSSSQECEVQSSRTQKNTKKRCQNKISQAPDFISNALGPTLDVSIIDNLKMMRDLFKCDSGKGEGSHKQSSLQVRPEVRLQNSEMEMNCRIEALHKKIEELERKENCLTRKIKDEEQERECKRKAFEEEEKKIFAAKSCFEKISCRKGNGESGEIECSLEALKMKVAWEEEKLLKLKNQTDCFKRELAEIQNKKESMKRNKSLLDAWDVFASRVCHTRLPAFSRAICLERKQFKDGDTGNLHCCFPTLLNEQNIEGNKPSKKCPSRSGCSDTQCSAKTKCQSSSGASNPCNLEGSCCDVSRSSSKEKNFGSQSSLICKIKMGEIQFPVQRDVICGLHQVFKSCTCKTPVKHECHTCTSEDDLMQKSKNMKPKCEHQSSCKTLSIDSDKKICHSKSDTSLKINKCTRIVKVMWATTRINVFQDNSRTYEVMDATPNAPACSPKRTEGIFVVKNTRKKVFGSSPRRNCPHSASQL